MSLPDKMDCLDDECMAPLACQFAGSCRLRQRDAARSYDEALSACREQGRIPKSWQTEGCKACDGDGGWWLDPESYDPVTGDYIRLWMPCRACQPKTEAIPKSWQEDKT